MEKNLNAEIDESRFGRYNVTSFLQYYIKSFERAIRREQRRIIRTSENETLMSDLGDIDAAIESGEDTILAAMVRESVSKTYYVDDIEIIIHDEDLIKAFDTLPPKKRNVVLLSFCTSMNDREIGKKMHITRNTVMNRRSDAVNIMHQVLEELQ